MTPELTATPTTTTDVSTKSTFDSEIERQIKEELAGAEVVGNALRRMIQYKYGVVPPVLTQLERSAIGQEERTLRMFPRT